MNKSIQTPQGEIEQQPTEAAAHQAKPFLGATDAQKASRESRLASWLPTRGNALFTLLVAGLLVMTQSIWSRPQPSPSATFPSTISFQGRLTSPSGDPLTGEYNIWFRIYDVPTGGTPLWEEYWIGDNSLEVSDGLLNVMLGSINNTLTSVIASHYELYLGITVGTDSDEMSPRVPLSSVPFSMQASNADTVDGLHASDLATDSTMVEGWPDAIKCKSSSQNLDTILYLTYDKSWEGNRMHYRQINYHDQIEVSFNIDGTFYHERNLNNSDCNGKSIAQLYSEGKAFNFVGRDP